MTNGEKIRKIYHRFTDPGEDIYQGIRIYKGNNAYELVIQEKMGKIKYKFQAYGHLKHWPDIYILPIESLDKIDLSNRAIELREQLIRLEIIYDGLEKDIIEIPYWKEAMDEAEFKR